MNPGSKLPVTLFGILLATSGLLAAKEPDLQVTISEPAEADAVPMETRLKTKEKIRKKLGEPQKTKSLDASAAPCVERWFYSGEVDLGFTKMTVLSYVDFDATGKTCKK